MAALLAYVWIMAFIAMMIVIHTPKAEGKSMTRQISAAGLAHIKHFEGCRLKSYYCTSGVCTIGYGHTGPEVKPGLTITQEKAEELLRQDLRHAEQAVAELVKVPLTDGQHAALVDLIFNIGKAAIAKSTLLKLLNARKYGDASEQLMRWVHSGGQIIAGLQRRRLAAREMWLHGR